MRFIGQAFAWIVVLVAIPALLYGIVRGVIEDPNIFGPLAPVLAAVFAVLAERWYSRRQDIKAAHREELLPIYAYFVDAIRNLDPDDLSELEQALEELKGALLLRGPASVITAYIEWWGSVPSDEDADPDTTVHHMLRLENVLRAIRRDLGIDDSDLDRGDLLRVFMTDVDEVLAGYKARHGALPT